MTSWSGKIRISSSEYRRFNGETDRLRARLAKQEEDLVQTRNEKQQIGADLQATRKTMKDIHSALAGAKAKARREPPGR